jgi:hypothetical protein
MGDRSGVDRVARALFYLQIPLIAISTTLLAVIGWKIQPMLAEYRQLQAKIANSSEEKQRLDSEIALQTSTLEQLKGAISRSGNKSLNETANRIFAANTALKGFKVGLYYLSSDSLTEQRAMGLEQKLTEYGVFVQRYPKDQDFLKTFPDSDEIIFDDPPQREQANALLDVLKSIDPGRPYQLRSSTKKPANFITLHLRTSASGK